MPLAAAIGRHRSGLPYCAGAMRASESPAVTVCERRPGRPADVGFVASRPSRLGCCCNRMVSSARVGVPSGPKRLYVTLTWVMFASMRNADGPPQLKITLGGRVTRLMPVAAASNAPPTAPSMPPPGLIQSISLSQRDLVSLPKNVTLLSVSTGGVDFLKMLGEEPDGV